MATSRPLPYRKSQECDRNYSEKIHTRKFHITFTEIIKLFTICPWAWAPTRKLTEMRVPPSCFISNSKTALWFYFCREIIHNIIISEFIYYYLVQWWTNTARGSNPAHQASSSVHQICSILSISRNKKGRKLSVARFHFVYSLKRFTTAQARNQGRRPPCKIFRPSLKNVLDIV